jgi:hypothetical protein
MASVQLDIEEWQRVLAVLAQGPWQTVNPLILKIGEQVRAQQQQPDDPNAGVRRGNSGHPRSDA